MPADPQLLGEAVAAVPMVAAAAPADWSFVLGGSDGKAVGVPGRYELRILVDGVLGSDSVAHPALLAAEVGAPADLSLLRRFVWLLPQVGSHVAIQRTLLTSSAGEHGRARESELRAPLLQLSAWPCSAAGLATAWRGLVAGLRQEHWAVPGPPILLPHLPQVPERQLAALAAVGGTRRVAGWLSALQVCSRTRTSRVAIAPAALGFRVLGFRGLGF